LMTEAEEYCKACLQLKTIYLSTKGEEKFYSKLGYIECQPISIYGSYTPTSSTVNIKNERNERYHEAPPPPPMPATKVHNIKTYMKKNL